MTRASIRFPYALASLAMVGATLLAACGGTVTTEPPPDAEQPLDGTEGDVPATPDVPGSALVLPADQVETLFRTSNSGLLSPRRDVIRTPEAWAAAWSELQGPVVPAPDLPDVDFATSEVLVLAMGQRSSGGYSIDVREVRYTYDTVYTSVLQTSPGPACVTTLALTRPAIALRIPRVADDVAFVEETAELDCG